MTNSDYKDLAPNDAIENGDEYLYSLNWALQRLKTLRLQGLMDQEKVALLIPF